MTHQQQLRRELVVQKLSLVLRVYQAQQYHIRQFARRLLFQLTIWSAPPIIAAAIAMAAFRRARNRAKAPGGTALSFLFLMLFFWSGLVASRNWQSRYPERVTTGARTMPRLQFAGSV